MMQRMRRIHALSERCVRVMQHLFRPYSANSPVVVSRNRLFREEINVLYDGKCSLCVFEINMIAKMDTKGRVKFTDIEDAEFDPTKPENANISYETAIANIHAVTSNGDILVGVPVFKAMYNAVGLGFLFAFTRFEILCKITDALYSVFAKYRTILSRGEDMTSLIAARNKIIMEKASILHSNVCDDEINCRMMKSTTHSKP